MTLVILLTLMSVGCSATTAQIIPTERPTISPTLTATRSPTPDGSVMPTASPTPEPRITAGGPSPTPLLGPSRTPSGDELTPTRVLNPNAPRIEFFTTDVEAAAPGSPVTLFWSTRNVTGVSIYRLNRQGQRERVWNERPDGTLTVATGARERGQLDFLLTAGEGELYVEQPLSIPLACPVQWFFSPPPQECAEDEAVETLLIEQSFQRGRMVFIETRNLVYVLFNDGFEPAWIAFENRYDPAIHPETEESFPGPQPIARLGFVWRGNDTVRNRLGLPLEPEIRFDGAIQTSTLNDGSESLYISSTNLSVLQLIEGGDIWQIITPP